MLLNHLLLRCGYLNWIPSIGLIVLLIFEVLMNNSKVSWWDLGFVSFTSVSKMFSSLLFTFLTLVVIHRYVANAATR